MIYSAQGITMKPDDYQEAKPLAGSELKSYGNINEYFQLWMKMKINLD